MAFLENANEPIWIHASDGRILDANRAAREHYGYTREECLGMFSTDLVTPEWRASVQEQMGKIIARGSGRLECSHVRKNGTVFSADVSVSSVGTDQGPLIMCIVRDTREIIPLNGAGRNSAVQAPVRGSMRVLSPLAAAVHGGSPRGPLGEAGLRFSFALDLVTEAVAILHAEDGAILYSNAPFAAMFGDPSRWAPGRTLWDLLQEDEACGIRASTLAQVREGKAWMGHSCWKTPAGKTIAFEGALLPLRNGEGAVESLVLRLRDITLELEKDRHLRQALKLDALGALAGGVAHDFNNLIGAILNATELIELQIEPQSPIRRNLETIQRVGSRAQELITQILNFDRRRDGKWSPIDLTSLATEVSNLLHGTLPANVKVLSELAEGIRVLGDPSQLHQVLMNLGINASQAMQPDGGILSIRLQPVEDDQRAIDPLLPQPCVRLTIEDTGCGMDAPTLERIFEPFFTTKEAGHGTGLGLPVVQGIVHGHGGSIHVSSQPGEGSSFQIVLPRQQETAKSCERHANGTDLSWIV